MSLFSRIVAYPESAQILNRQVGLSICYSLRWAVLQMVPFLLKAYFGASNAYSLIATMSGPVTNLLTVFWGDLYRRMDVVRYAWILWLLGVVPLAGIGLSPTAGWALVLVVIASLASPGIIPVTGDILRACYSPLIRGRVWASVTTVSLITGSLAAYVLGAWMDYDKEGFRIYFPAVAVIQLAAVALLASIARKPLFAERQRAAITGPTRRAALTQLQQMWQILRDDRRFLRFEVSFMLYGVGWMICFALLPVLANDKLRLTFGQYANSTQVALRLTTVAATPLMGFLIDRIGPVRMAAAAFALLVVYPIGLWLATGPWTLALATIWYGVGMAAIFVCWTVGPVTLARRAEDASQYAAIHASMTGVRGLLFQPLGMGLYEWTGSFAVPLVLASIGFALGTYGMYTLDRQMRKASSTMEATVEQTGAQGSGQDTTAPRA